MKIQIQISFFKSLIRLVFQYVFVILSLVSLLFFFQWCLPGSPADLVLGPQASLDQKKEWLREKGLLDPLGKQYLRHLKSLAQGDFGMSLIHREPVLHRLSSGLQVSFKLTILAFVLILIISFGFGFLGFYAFKFSSFYVTWLFLMSLFMGMPAMVLGPLILYFFGVKLQWFEILISTIQLKSLFFPALSLALPLSAFNGQILAERFYLESRANYTLFSQSLGLSPSRLFFQVIFRNSALSLVTILTLQLGALLSGAVVVEKIFGLPGVGRLMIQSVQDRDFPVLSGSVTLIGFIYTSLNLFGDLLYAFWDPRVRLS